MKRLLAVLLVCAMFLSLVNISMANAQSTETLAEIHSLQITSVTMKKQTSSLSWDVKLKNVTGESIDSFTLQMRFYDKQGKRLLEYIHSLEGYAAELRILEYSPNNQIKNKNTYTATEKYKMYLSAGRMEVAVQSYQPSKGRIVRLNQDQLIWYGSDKSVSKTPIDTKTYIYPDESEFMKGNTFAFGYNALPLFDDDAMYYFHEKGGLWISNVDKGSLAEQAELLPNDVIISVDDKVLTFDTLYEIYYGKNRMAEGKSIVLEIERSGSIYELTLSKNPNEIIPVNFKK